MRCAANPRADDLRVSSPAWIADRARALGAFCDASIMSFGWLSFREPTVSAKTKQAVTGNQTFQGELANGDPGRLFDSLLG